jgi:hypothetical protein
MHPTANSSGTDTPSTVTPAFIASLIESAASTFEVALAASHEYRFRAYALASRAGQTAANSIPDPARSRLAAWPTKRSIAYSDWRKPTCQMANARARPRFPDLSTDGEGSVRTILEWRQIKGERFAELKTIKQQALVANGANDIMVPTINS